MILHDTVDKMYVAVAKELKQNSNMIESRNGDTYMAVVILHNIC